MSSSSLHQSASKLEDFIAQIKNASQAATPEERVKAVHATLENYVREHPSFLPEHYLQPQDGHYARWPLYIDPEEKLSIYAMVWKPGQGTVLHDHGGISVVECVYQGTIHVTNYAYEGELNGVHHFHVTADREDQAGIADYRTPSEEHHTVKNDNDQTAVTIHVFDGILITYNMFEPVGDGYKKTEYTVPVTA